MMTEEDRRAKNREKSLRYAQRHPERVKASRAKANAKLKEAGYFQQWAKNNPEKMKAKDARWRAAHPERAREKVRRHRAANLDAVRQQDAAHKRQVRAADPDGHRDRYREWQRSNPERLANYLAERQRRAKGKLSPGLRALLMAEQGGRCPYCLGDLTALRPTFDHYMPLKLGGLHSDANMQLTCKPCNSQKSGKHPAKFLCEIIEL